MPKRRKDVGVVSSLVLFLRKQKFHSLEKKEGKSVTMRGRGQVDELRISKTANFQISCEKAATKNISTTFSFHMY